MTKKTTLGDFVTLIIFGMAVLWIYFKCSVHREYGEIVPDYNSLEEIFQPGFPAFFHVWPFAFAVGGQLLVMLFHLLKDGNVAHYRSSRIGTVFGLYLAAMALTFVTSPVILFVWDESRTTMIYIMTAVFMTIYGCLEGSSLFLRLINLRLEEGNPVHEYWMNTGGDPVVDHLPGAGGSILELIVIVAVALVILHYSTLWFIVFVIVCGLVKMFGMIPRL